LMFFSHLNGSNDGRAVGVEHPPVDGGQSHAESG
jgi:hypothetical protein